MRTSNSRIQTFKACRRLYELKYVYGLEPVQTAEALKRGSQYHDLVEGLLIGQSRFRDCDDPKVKAMATAFQMYVMPHVVAEATEEWFSYKTKSGHEIIGRIDGRTPNGQVIEHKTTSGAIDGAYWSKLERDEQIMTYMVSQNSNAILYTVCATPTIRQKKGETDEEFYLRCVDWFSVDTESKIVCKMLYCPDETLERFKDEQDAIVTEMENCKLFYRNPNHCSRWGRVCEYAPICMNYDPSAEYIQFEKRGDYYEEVGKAEVREANRE